MRKLLTLEDLYNYYSSKGRSTHFSAKNDGDKIVVQVGGNINFESDDKNSEFLMPVTLMACHTQKNLNQSFISDEVMTKALPSFSNRPILGYIYQDNNGEYQFRDHAMHVENDEIVYDEICVGIIPESNDIHLEYDEENDVNRVVVNGYIFEDYTKASEILKREGECSVSVELSINKLSYNAKEKMLVIEDFIFSGITILGRWEDGSEVKPGMSGSNIKIADFKQKNNEIFSREDIVTKLTQFENKLDQLLTTVETKKGGTPVKDFEENVDVTETEEVENTTEVVDTEAEESIKEVTVTETEESAEVTPVEDETAEEKFTKQFELSHEDVRSALYVLLAPYEEADNEWYFISKVFDNHFIYQGWIDETKLYDQKYIKDGDNITFDGERVHMNIEYLTDSELVALNEMRSNYSSISEKLQRYEEEPDKLAILQSDEYSDIADSEEFKEFCKRESYFEMSVEDVKSKADAMLLEAAKAHKVDFSVKEEKKSVGMKKLPIMNKSGKSGRYGGLFSKK
jgi:hypothetical protein